MAAIYKLDSTFDRSRFKNASCAFGVFDGLHRGHQYLLKQAIAGAKDSGGAAVALTFDIDPDELFNASALRKLMTNDDRLCALAQSGVDEVFVLPFTPTFAALSPTDFLTNTFGVAAPSHIYVGKDARFGARAQGSVADFSAWGSQRATKVHACSLQQADGGVISSTRIRALLARGEIEEANALLGHPYYVKGTVLAGRGEGAHMGFRTANMALDDMYRAIGDGVYAAYAYVDGVRYKAAVNVGIAPMFKDASATIEAHLLDFSGDLYGRTLQVEFRNWLRAKQSFPTVDDLISTVKSNIAWVREHL